MAESCILTRLTSRIAKCSCLSFLLLQRLISQLNQRCTRFTLSSPCTFMLKAMLFQAKVFVQFVTFTHAIYTTYLILNLILYSLFVYLNTSYPIRRFSIIYLREESNSLCCSLHFYTLTEAHQMTLITYLHCIHLSVYVSK
jgi:hypothetical protein